MRSHHFFDWDGFTFFAKIVLLLALVGAVGRLGFLYTTQSSSLAASPSLVLIQEKHPALGKSLSLTLSTTTSEHIINTLTIRDAVPPLGKFIAVDLTTMVLTLYQDGSATMKYPILAKGAPGSLYETPAGFYTVLTKAQDHWSGEEQTHLPWSVQFYGNYFIHGWPSYDDSSPVNTSYVGGDIRLSTEEAKSVYDFADIGTGIFVYDPLRTASIASLTLDAVPTPAVSAMSYIVADIDTGDVFLDQRAQDTLPITSATTLVTALVANEAIPFDTKIDIPRSVFPLTKTNRTKVEETFTASDLLYPLLMGSSDIVAQRLLQEYGASGFIDWMNATTKALDMPSTHFVNASSTSSENVSTADDLFRLATYLANRKSFVLDTTHLPSKDLVASSGNVYHLDTTATKNTELSVFSIPINGIDRRIAIIVLKSNNPAADILALTEWFTRSAEQGADMARTVCVTCAIPVPYRKISF